MNRANPATPAGNPRSYALAAIAGGGLLAGLLDITNACVYWGVQGVPSERVLQSVASGLLGRAAFDGGPAAAALGLALHFFMSLCAAAAYHSASRRLPVLVERAIPCGIAYGIAFLFLMSYVVVPLSAFPQSGPLEITLNALFAHTILFGLPIALMNRRAARRAALAGRAGRGPAGN